MSKFMPKTASVQQIQKAYRPLFDEVIEKREPLVILSNNKPEVVVVDVETFEDLMKIKEEWEWKDTKEAIEEAEKELKEGKLKELKSLADLIDENKKN